MICCGEKQSRRLESRGVGKYSGICFAAVLSLTRVHQSAKLTQSTFLWGEFLLVFYLFFLSMVFSWTYMNLRARREVWQRDRGAVGVEW